MNIFDYEPIEEIIDPNKTWVNIENKVLYSKELITKAYFTLGKKVNINNYYEYYIIFLDNPPVDRGYYKRYVDSFGRCLIDLKHIWTELGFDRFENNRRVFVEFEEQSEDMIVYRILKG